MMMVVVVVDSRTWFRLEALEFVELPHESNWNACWIVPKKPGHFWSLSYVCPEPVSVK